MKHPTKACGILALLSGALILTTQSTPAADKTWSGGAGDKLWSTAGNWSPAGAPDTGDGLTFDQTDLSGTPKPAGISNSVVDAAFTATPSYLHFRFFTNTVAATATFPTHHVFIGTSNLTIAGTTPPPTTAGQTANAILIVGSDNSVDDGYDATNYTTISGSALVVSNRTADIYIRQGSATAGPHRAWLDLSGLDNFTATVSSVRLAYEADNLAQHRRPTATFIMARTNVIAGTASGYGYVLGDQWQQSGAATTNLLGHANYFYMNAMAFGGRKVPNNTRFQFNTGLPANPFVVFRGLDGTSRQNTWVIGDNSGTAASSVSAYGIVDLSNGTVDARVDTIIVGRGQATVGNSGYYAFGNGTLTFNRGLIDVNNLRIAVQNTSGRSAGGGTVNVNGTGLLQVNNDVVLALNLPGSPTNSVGRLFINGGTVNVAGSIVDGGGIGSLSVTNNGTLYVAGDIGVKNLYVGVATLTNSGFLAATNITVRAPATEFAPAPSQALAPWGQGVAGTLKVDGSLRLANNVLKFDLADTASANDQIAVTNVLTLEGVNTADINPIGAISTGTYTLMTYGPAADPALAGDASNLSVGGPLASSRYALAFDTSTPPNINLNVSGGPAAALTWDGGLNGSAWNLTNTLNWHADGAANSEKFHSLDAVTFDGSSANTAVALSGTLMPSAITVSADYTFGGSGRISGPANLTLNGGALVMLTTNDYTGGTVLNGGTLQLGNGTTADGGLAGSIENNAALIFKPAATQNVAGILSSYGSITKQGPGVTRLAGANTLSSSSVTVEAGTLLLANASALGTSPGVTIQDGGTLDIGGQRLDTKNFIVAGAGAGGEGAIVNSGAAQGNAFTGVSMTGDTTFGGSGRFDINNPSGNLGGLSANGFNITKVGANAVSFYNNVVPFLWDIGANEIDVRSGVLRVQQGVVLGDPDKTLRVRTNATLQLDNLWEENPLSKVVVLDDGAGVYASRGTSNLFGGPITLNGLNVFDAAANVVLQITNSIGGTGSLVKGLGYHPGSPETSTGMGRIILAASNAFTGDLRVQLGTLALTNDASVTKAASLVLAGGTLDVTGRTDGRLTLATGQSLQGTGTILGDVNAPANTTVAPGESIGTLTVNGTVTLRGTTTLELSKAGATKMADKIAATSVDLGGTLNVTYSGDALAAGDTFTLFTGALTGQFDTVNLPVIPSVVWTNKTHIDGTIQVLSAEPTEPPVLTGSFAGDQVALSWSTAYTSYVLKGQTNPVTVGLLTNAAAWGPVPGVSGNQVTVPVDPANGSVFFKLFKP